MPWYVAETMLVSSAPSAAIGQPFAGDSRTAAVIPAHAIVRTAQPRLPAFGFVPVIVRCMHPLSVEFHFYFAAGFESSALARFGSFSSPPVQWTRRSSGLDSFDLWQGLPESLAPPVRRSFMKPGVG